MENKMQEIEKLYKRNYEFLNIIREVIKK